MYPYSNGYDVNPLRAAYASPTTQYTAPIRYILNRPNDYRRCISTAESDFLAMNRLLWMEHVNWTRMTIISIVFDLPDLPFVQQRLLRNATDLGNCLRPFYGDQIADRYAAITRCSLISKLNLTTFWNVSTWCSNILNI